MIQNLRSPSAWAGVWTAIVTPLNAKRELDDVGLEKLIEGQILCGVRGLVIAGSTGEGSLLPAATFENLLAASQRLVRGRIPLVAGLGIGGTESCLKNLELARRHGFAGVLAAPPAYVKAPQRGLRDHFLRLAEGALPICLYEIPGRAATSIQLETLVEIAESNKTVARNIIAIKDASANMQRALDQKRLLKDRFALLSGDDFTYAPFLASGGHGVISVVSHFVPRSMNFILNAVKAGKLDLAVQEQNRIAPLIDALFWESNPIPTKALLAAQGIIREAHFCEPLCAMKKDLLDKLVECAKHTQDLTNA